MTSLALAARNFLEPRLVGTNLLGGDDLWPAWIFVDYPEVVIESTGKAMIVLTADGGWSAANDHNTARFPTLIVDIWVDPTRNPDGSVYQRDAKLRGNNIYRYIDKFLHQVDNSSPDGDFIYWGTEEEIASKTGVRIFSSVRAGEPTYSKAFDDQGAYMATVRYNIETD